jgi:hypothetical protein
MFAQRTRIISLLDHSARFRASYLYIRLLIIMCMRKGYRCPGCQSRVLDNIPVWVTTQECSAVEEATRTGTLWPFHHEDTCIDDIEGIGAEYCEHCKLRSGAPFASTAVTPLQSHEAQAGAGRANRVHETPDSLPLYPQQQAAYESNVGAGYNAPQMTNRFPSYLPSDQYLGSQQQQPNYDPNTLPWTSAYATQISDLGNKPHTPGHIHLDNERCYNSILMHILE